MPPQFGSGESRLSLWLRRRATGGSAPARSIFAALGSHDSRAARSADETRALLDSGPDRFGCMRATAQASGRGAVATSFGKLRRAFSGHARHQSWEEPRDRIVEGSRGDPRGSGHSPLKNCARAARRKEWVYYSETILTFTTVDPSHACNEDFARLG